MVEGPMAGLHYPAATGEFMAWFSTDADCLDYLEWLRWPSGFVCPECGQGGWRLGGRPVRVLRVQAAYVGDCGDDLRPHADAADRLVHRLLAVRRRQGRHLGAEPAAIAGDRLVSDRVGDAAPAALGAGAPWPGAADRGGRGRRDLHRWRGTGTARRPRQGQEAAGRHRRG